jgi:hypothetical protein
MADSLTLIVKGNAEPENTEASGQAARTAQIATHAVSIDAGLIQENIDKCLAQLRQVFTHLREPSIEGWSVGTITVGLSVTAQGSIGIATAGLEASLEVTFKPNG